MARLDITNIDMDEIHVKVGGTTQTSVSMNDSDVRGMAAPDVTYSGSDGINTANNSTIAIGEFRNGEHTSIDSFPSLNNWDTFETAVVGSGTYQQAESFCSMSFTNDTTNNRVILSYYGGTNAGFATVYTSYLNYTGIDHNNVDVFVRYTYPSTVNNLPNPITSIGTSTSYPPYGWPGHSSNTATTSTAYHGGGYRKVKDTDYKLSTSGTYTQFKWLVRTNAAQYSTQQRSIHHRDVSFQIRFTSDGTLYSSTSSDQFIALEAFKGAIF